MTRAHIAIKYEFNGKTSCCAIDAFSHYAIEFITKSLCNSLIYYIELKTVTPTNATVEQTWRFRFSSDRLTEIITKRRVVFSRPVEHAVPLYNGPVFRNRSDSTNSSRALNRSVFTFHSGNDPDRVRSNTVRRARRRNRRQWRVQRHA